MTRTLRISTRHLLVAMLAASTGFATSAPAATPGEVMQDPTLEIRDRTISQNFLVRQNQTIDDSNAPLAHDPHMFVRKQLVLGDSDEQALDFIVARYGNFVLHLPLQSNTLALCIGQASFLLTGAIGFDRYLRRQSGDEAREPPPMSLAVVDQQRLDELLSERRPA